MFEDWRENEKGEISPNSIHQKTEEIFLGDLVLVSEGPKLLKTVKYIIQIINV